MVYGYYNKNYREVALFYYRKYVKRVFRVFCGKVRKVVNTRKLFVDKASAFGSDSAAGGNHNRAGKHKKRDKERQRKKKRGKEKSRWV